MGINAQTSVPKFTIGDVLTAANTNLLTNAPPVFSGTATRDAAFGGAGEKTLAEGQLCYLEDSNIVQYYDGAAWATVGPTTALTYAIFNETQAAATNGGTFTAGSYVKRVLNTTLINTISGCSIASSVITLPAGTYNVYGFAPAYKVNVHKLRVQNTTASTTIAQGVNAYIGSGGDYAMTHSFVNTTFTLTGSTTIELQHRAQSTQTTNGFGVDGGAMGDEIYAQIVITKVA
jgi:hypothetical protein